MASNVQHVRRGSRDGYKTRALAPGTGFRRRRDGAAFIDARFRPIANFLKLRCPTGLQLSSARCRALGTHQQPAKSALRGNISVGWAFRRPNGWRNRAGWLVDFNGSGGVWRVKAIESAGGWQATT